MQNEQMYNNYFNTQYVMNGPRTNDNCATTAAAIHGTYRTSPQSIKPQKSFDTVHSSQQQFEQQRRQVSPNRRSSHFDGPHLTNLDYNPLPRNPSLQFVPQSTTADPLRTSYRAPLLKANGRSLSARDSQEEFEKMNGKHCAIKLLNRLINTQELRLFPRKKFSHSYLAITVFC